MTVLNHSHIEISNETYKSLVEKHKDPKLIKQALGEIILDHFSETISAFENFNEKSYLSITILHTNSFIK